MSVNEKRVFVAIDIQNLWYAAQESFGKSHRVNFAKLRRAITSNNTPPCEIEAIAYVVTAPDHDNQKFIEMLERLKYIVKTRHMGFDKARGIAYKSDWDVGITVDALLRGARGEIDKFILVSGDGDYFYLCEALAEMGVSVDVYTFDNVCSRVLREIVNVVFILDRSVTYSIRGKYDS